MVCVCVLFVCCLIICCVVCGFVLCLNALSHYDVVVVCITLFVVCCFVVNCLLSFFGVTVDNVLLLVFVCVRVVSRYVFGLLFLVWG